jgi:hypothetical protein
METYRATEAVRVPVGAVIGLDARQHASRAHDLDAMKPDRKSGRLIVRVKRPVEFKAGELVGFASVPKVIARALVRAESERDAG